MTVAQALDSAVAKVAPAFTGQPEIEGAVRHTLGATYQLLGRYDEAGPQLERALALRESELGAEHLATLESRSDLAELAWRRGDFEDAERRTRELLELHRHIGGEASAGVAKCRQFLAQVLVALPRSAASFTPMRRPRSSSLGAGCRICGEPTTIPVAEAQTASSSPP